MKRKLLSGLLLVAALSFGLAACDKEEINKSTSPTTTKHGASNNVLTPSPVLPWEPFVCVDLVCTPKACLDPFGTMGAALTWNDCEVVIKANGIGGVPGTADWNAWIFLEDPAVNPSTIPRRMTWDAATNTYTLRIPQYNGTPCTRFITNRDFTTLTNNGGMISVNANGDAQLDCSKPQNISFWYGGPSTTTTPPQPYAAMGYVMRAIECCH